MRERLCSHKRKRQSAQEEKRQDEAKFRHRRNLPVSKHHHSFDIVVGRQFISSFNYNIAMSNPQEGPNPLRPYYIPPSVGLAPATNIHPSTTQAIGSKHATSINTKPSFGSSARDILSDLDYSDYLSDASPSAVEVVKGVVDQALWKYTSVLLAQPFEVTKTVLQVQLSSATKDGSLQAAENNDMRRQPRNYRQDDYDVNLSRLVKSNNPTD